MKIRILSREKIEALAKKPFAERTALISITDFHCEFAELNNSPDYLLQLAFDDVDADVFFDNPNADRLAVESKYHMFSDEQAQKIAEFYHSVRDHADVLICQCEHGQSRSAAIAAAILEYKSRSGIKIFADDRYYPNKFIFKKALKAISG